MNLTTPIIIIIVLLITLFVLMLMLVSRPSKKKPQQKKKKVSAPSAAPAKRMRSFDELITVLKHKKSSAAELDEALKEMVRHYGKITPKLGTRAHPDFDNYMLAVVLICRHPNTTKNLILDFDRELSRRNPEYKRDINSAIQKGLNARG